jgi:putative OPT family oligopeptide transporter
MTMQNESLPEITIKAVILGVLLSMILAAANAYLGLFAGMTVSASIPAAVVSMGILRFFRKNNILENNIVQTAASAGESLAAGVIFTLPALVIMGFWKEFNFFWVTLIAGFGGLLGVLFTIPLRRSLIVEDKLQFPEGIATAEVLETGQKGGSGVKHIAAAAGASSLFKIGAGGIGLWPATVEGARRVGGSLAYFGSDLSPALLAVGYIVGLNIAILIFLGGVLNWYVAIPIVAATSHSAAGQAAAATDYAYELWSAKTRYLGVGGMLLGGLWTIFAMRRSLVRGVVSGLRAYKGAGGDGRVIDRTERDMPMKWILVLIVASIVPLFLVYEVFVKDFTISLPMAAVMLVAGFIFSAVAGYMAGLVGSSNNPISGVTIATVTVSALLLLLLMGSGSASGPAAAIIIGSVVCCAAAIAGDNMQDLKTGYLVGATPWRQQVMQMIGTVAGAVVIAPVLMLLYKAYGFAGQAGAGPDALAAVQANLMASVARGVFTGDLPWTFVFIGMGIAAAVIALDEYLKRIGSTFRTPVLAVTIGIYLPLELAVPIFAGGLIHHACKVFHRRRGTSAARAEAAGRNGLLFASGLITGEALMGILLAIPIVILKQYNIRMPILKHFMGRTLPYGALLGVILLLAVAYWLYRTAIKSNSEQPLGSAPQA